MPMTAHNVARAMTEPASQAAPVRIVGRYAVYGEIAAGGMATVHLGRLIGPVGFSRTVAVKRLHAHFAKDPEFVTMLLDEARLAARIQHPNVVQTLDVVPMEGELFLVMEYVAGESLARLLRRARKLNRSAPPHIVTSVVAGMLHGLHAAHEAKSERGAPLGIVHRDVSPQNVLVGLDGVPRVLDFGIAKAITRIASTRNGQLKGKLSYMSPEQLRGASADRRTDVFAAGIVLWEALTARRLFEGADQGELIGRVLNLEIVPPSTLVDGLPLALDAVVLKALERDRDNRYADARQFAIALEKAIVSATPREVGEWVEEIVGDQLAARAARVAGIESESAVLGDENWGAPGFNAAAALDADSIRTSGFPPPPAVTSGVRSSTAPSIATVAHSPELTSQISSISISTGVNPFARKKRGVFALAIAVAGILVTVMLFRELSEPEPPNNVALPAPANPKPVSTPAAAATTPAANPRVSAESQAPPRNEADKASERSSERRQRNADDRADRRGSRHEGSSSAPAPSAAAATPVPAVNCNPPYKIDERGIRRIKPECL
jgi:eukaryotic-like serine/threonine-protein kinase